MNTILVDLISLIQSVGMQASDFILQQHDDVAFKVVKSPRRCPF